MSRSLTHTQRIAIELSLNIYRHTSNTTYFAVLPLFSLTPLFLWLWAIRDRSVASMARFIARVVFTFDRFIDWLAMPITLPKTLSKTMLKTPVQAFLQGYGLVWEVKGV